MSLGATEAQVLGIPVLRLEVDHGRLEYDDGSFKWYAVPELIVAPLGNR